MKIWILVANSAEAKILATDKLRTGELDLVAEFAHPESRKKGSELMSDGPGHYKTDFGAHGAYDANDPKEVEAENFAMQLLRELRVGLDQHKFNKLIVVTPAHFYGILKKHMHFDEIEVNHIAKDYTKYTVSQLHSSLKEHYFKMQN